VEHPEISNAMLKRKIDDVDGNAAETVVTCDAGCLMHIQGGLRQQRRTQRVVHLAEILAQTGHPDR
jgi:L-lactate dehydrogenase complex protein LldE